ncbi:hypothetical protein, partial [Prevotellamassilia timonensis]|uniref:hypothetical protein n=1 Tax=Prevotellamassilia timonensis TaxID=1852370 RepID=UPI0030806413
MAKSQKILLSGKTILILYSRITPIARIFFACTTCFSTTEMTDLTDFVSIACSLRYLPVTY